MLVVNDGHTQLFPTRIRPTGQMRFTRWLALFGPNDERKKFVKSLSCGKASDLRMTAENTKMVTIIAPLDLNKLALVLNMMKN